MKISLLVQVYLISNHTERDKKCSILCKSPRKAKFQKTIPRRFRFALTFIVEIVLNGVRRIAHLELRALNSRMGVVVVHITSLSKGYIA